jgi:amino acid adenylation domain-containing protein/FkbM family methyltransferase
VEYATDLFTAATIARWMAQWTTLLASAVAAPETSVWALPLMSASEVAAVQTWGTGPLTAVPGDVADGIAAWATATPEAIAIVDEGDNAHVSYAALHAQVTAVATTLAELGVGPDVCVALALDPSPAVVVGILAVWAAGGAYVPLDAAWPVARTAAVLDETQAPVILTQTRRRARLPVSWAQGVRLDAAWPPPATPHVPRRPRPAQLAYVLYTSGSTGRPKGVLVTHAGLRHYLQWSTQTYAGTGGDATRLHTPVGFDLTVTSLFGGLLCGGGLRIAAQPDLETLHTALASGTPSGVLKVTPSHLRGLRAWAGPARYAVETCVVGGEALTGETVEAWWRQAPASRVINEYGPTETTVGCCWWEVQAPVAPGPVPIGRPIAHTQAYVVEPSGVLAAPGVAGELWVGGVGVARGYLGQPGLTAARFVPDAFSGAAGARVYRTGDRARWRGDGVLEYLGRLDAQVKLRGYRVEPGEIETVLRAQPGVRAAAVVLRHDPPAEPRLVAYVVPQPSVMPPPSGTQRLPNGWAVYHQNRYETDYLYREIVERDSYLQHDIWLADDACVLDVGANIGLFTLHAAARCPRGHVYAFEPLAPVCETLRRNVALHQAPATIFEIGLGAGEQTEEFTYYPRCSMMSGLRRYADGAPPIDVARQMLLNVPSNETVAAATFLAEADDVLTARFAPQRTTVSLRRLSDVIDEQAIARIDLLKIDVEGAELDVLAGIDARHWPRVAQVVMEVHDQPGTPTAGQLRAVTSLLEERGFTVTAEQDPRLRETWFYNLYASRPSPDGSPARSAPRAAATIAPPTLTVGSLRDALRAELPEYLIPDAVVLLERLPLTPNGKLDRAALPAPDVDAYAARGYEAPEGGVETALAAIWAELLHVERVGRRDNFFELGGHSLLAVRAVARAQQALGVELDIGDLFAWPVLADLAQHVAQVAPLELPPIATAIRDEIVPLSFAQQRLWFLAQMEGVSETYHIALGMRLNGPLNRKALIAALDRIVWRHEGLRTTFGSREGEPTQQIAPAETSTFHLIEHAWAAADPAAAERALEWLVGEESAAPFDLVQGPLIRGRLIRQAADRHVLLVTMHHIVSDGWSTGILLNELSTLYGAYARGENDPLPALTLQYADYAIWQRRWLDGDLLQRQAAYWQSALQDAPTLLAVPGDRARPAAQDYAGERVGIVLEAELTARLKALGQRHGCTLYMTLLAAWAALVGRLAGQTDVVIGTPAANRRRTEIEGLIGFFVNTLAVRIDLGGAPTVSALLARVTQQAVGAQQHQDLPFEQVVELLQPIRSLSHTPIFQVMFAWQNAPRGTVDLAGLDVQPLGSAGPRPTSKYDLALSLQESGNRIIGGVAYATALFERQTIERYLGYFRGLLEAMVVDAQQIVERLTLLPDAERTQVLYGWNRRGETYPRRQGIHELFEDQAERTPDSVAVIYGEHALSYGALNRRTNQLAHYLRARGVGPSTLVGTAFGRSLDAIVSMVGILKAGGAYLPLDHDYPIERLDFIVADARPAYVLTTSAIRSRLPETCPCLLLDDAAIVADLDAQPSARPEHRAYIGTVPAYVIYTSGSTGQPKGVVAPHDGLVNLVWDQLEAMAMRPSSRLLQCAALNFDVAVTEITRTLAAGATLVLPKPDERVGDALAATIRRQQITHVTLSPRVMATLPDDELPIETLITGIEPCPGALVERWSRGRRMLNGYGPTETTVCSTMTGALTGREAPSIGRPIANTQVYVLDEAMQPAPVGVAGELYIGGAGVTHGYLNRPVFTADRFVPDPFGDVAGARLYRTGDLGKWRGDGTIEFLGRNDFQVKIRGFRVELGEIEAQLVEQEGVGEVVVVARDESSGEKRLVAYYTTRNVAAAARVGAETLRRSLSAVLPDYMVPAAYVRLDDLPRTLNGKVNRNALPAPGDEAYVARGYEAPIGEMETALAAMWAEVLHVERVGRHDNFFELGGHSLLAVKLVEKMRVRGLQVDVRTLFSTPTLADLAAIESPPALLSVPPPRIPAACDAIVPEMLPLVALSADEIAIVVRSVAGGAPNVQDIYPLAPLQEGILFHHLMDRTRDPYLGAVQVSFDSRARLDAYLDAMRAVIDRHDILRTAVVWEGLSVPVQVVWRSVVLPVEEVELDEADGAIAEQLYERFHPLRYRLDLSRAPLMRIYVAHVRGQDRWVVLKLFHHLAGDHSTLDVMQAEIKAHLLGTSDQLPPPLPYRNWVAQMRQDMASDQHEAYFRRMLADVEEPTAAFGLLNVQGDGRAMTDAHVAIDPALARRIRERARALKVSAASLWHLAFAQVLASASGRADVVFGTVLFGRLQGGVGGDGVMGLFINTLPLRIQVSDGGVETTARGVHAQLSELLRHEHASLSVVQRCSGVKAPAPLFAAVLNYRHQPRRKTPTPETPQAAHGVELLRAQERSNYPLALSVEDMGEDFTVTTQVQAPVDPVRVCEYMRAAIESLIDALETAPERPVCTMQVLPEAEWQQYRTGDRDNQRDDGTIESSGRNDLADGDAHGARTYEAPVGEAETALASIWAELLHVERVSRHDNFFELGGHSLVAVRLVLRVHQVFGVELEIGDLFVRPVLAELARGLAHAAPSELPPVTPAVRDEVVPLSFAQQRLWFLAQIEGVSETYHISVGLRLNGPLHRGALVGALNRIVWRHEALRTTFALREGEPTQQITPPEHSRFELLEHTSTDVDAAALERLVAEESGTPFDLVRGPLIRGRLIRLAPDRHALLITMHHIVSDGWSMGIFLSELGMLYGAYVRGEIDPLPALTLQYADYAIWQRRWLDGEVLQRQAAYWQTALAEAPTLLAVPGDHARPAVQEFAADVVSVALTPALTAGLKALSRQHGCTLYMTLLAAWAALLGRVAGQTDVVIGTPIANRRRTEIEGLIGFFVNTLAVRIDLTGTPTVGALLARVTERAVGAQQHQDLPFEQVVEMVQPVRSLSHTPLFQVMFAWQNVPKGTADLAGLDVQPLGSAGLRPTSKFDMSLSLQQSGDGIIGGVAYATALFERRTIERYLGYFHTLLDAMAADAQQVVDRLPLLPEAERTQVLYAWNRRETYRRRQTIDELFENQAEQTPDAVAIVDGDRVLSYGELNRRTNQLARYLRDLGVGPQTLVGTAFNRSLEAVVSTVAILKAGGAYLPLDQEYPIERLNFIIDDARPAYVLTTSAIRDRLPASATCPSLALDEATVVADLENSPASRLDRQARNLQEPAYVIYTSGSTGQPKGVIATHDGLVNLATAHIESMELGPTSRFLQFASLNFDAAVVELAWTLTRGAALVVSGPDERIGPALAEAMRRDQVTHVLLSPRVIATLPDGDVPLETLITGIEPCPGALVERWSRGRRMLNAYGPTEITVIASMTGVLTGREAPSIGRPIANTQMYVLDDHMQPAPTRVAGELYIGGAGVTQGYLNRPALTAERFVPDPFGDVAGARLYRTGDLGRWRDDGTIEFLGRNDFQVKIRGFRVELGEIEARLLEQPGVREAIVVARDEAAGDTRLVAYYTTPKTEKGPDANALRMLLSATLPEHMVPAAYVRMDDLPRTLNGKLNRKALPAPSGEAYGARSDEAPVGEMETALAAIWAEMLHVERVSRHDNFFELGGHSLVAIRIIERLRSMRLHIDVRDMFASPTLAGLAAAIDPQRELFEVPPNRIPEMSESVTDATNVIELRL